MKETQKQRILKALQQGYDVTQVTFDLACWVRELKKIKDGYRDLSIANVPARIFDLKKDGYNIETINIPIKGKYGNTYYSIYRLVNETN